MTETHLQERLAANFRRELVKELKREEPIFRLQVFASAHTHLVADIDNFGKNIRVLRVAINAAKRSGDDVGLNGILSCLERTCRVLHGPARAERAEQSFGGRPGNFEDLEEQSTHRQKLVESQRAVHREMIAKRALYEQCLAVIDPIRMELRRFLGRDSGKEK